MPKFRGAKSEPAGATSGREPRPVLPRPMTRLIGRDAEIAEITAQLEAARLVTLVGPGGTGKTRIAIAVAENDAAEGHLVAFADLSALEDAALVGGSLASALGLRATADQAPVDLIAGRIGERPVTIVVDNMERLLAAAPTLADLVERCARLRLLVTSRIPLRLSMERTYEILPLGLPTPRWRDPGTASAVRLFVERARAVNPHLEIGPAECDTIAEICARLDGLPLAIELAAARVRHMPLRVLLDRLEDPLSVLDRGPVDAPSRHQTLRRAIEWSFEMLGPVSRHTFARLSVFRGSFGLAAAHEIVGAGLTDSESQTLEILSELVDHSLLHTATSDRADPRFRMHDTISRFASEQLSANDDAANRHAVVFARLADGAELGLQGPEQYSWKLVLGLEIENLRAALRRTQALGQRGSLLHFAASLGGYWRLHGDLREGAYWLTAALEGSREEDGQDRSLALRRLARIVDLLGDRQRSVDLFAEAVDMAERTGDDRSLAEALCGLGLVMIQSGDVDGGVAPVERALRVARSTGDPRVIAPVLNSVAQMRASTADPEAVALFMESAEAARESGDRRIAGIALVNAADVLLGSGDAGRAVQTLNAGMAELEAVDDTAYIGSANLLLGLTMVQLGDLEAARAHVIEGLRQARHTGAAEDEIFGLEVAATWLGAAGAHREALHAWGAAAAARKQQGFLEVPTDRVHFDPPRRRDRAAMTAHDARKAWDAGASQHFDVARDQAVLVLSELILPGASPRDAGGHHVEALTPREQEVLTLVAAGHSDKEIAAQLFISPKTASVHVSNIKGKLQAMSRVEIATMALRGGLIEPVHPRVAAEDPRGPSVGSGGRTAE